MVAVPGDNEAAAFKRRYAAAAAAAVGTSGIAFHITIMQRHRILQCEGPAPVVNHIVHMTKGQQ